jgi:acyl-CoA reductase-like NAD-dependent aldehyde dehydrogenase
MNSLANSTTNAVNTAMLNPPTSIPLLVQAQREFYQSGQTRDMDFRVQQLKRLLDVVTRHEADILQALKADLNKPPLEAYGSEVGLLRAEIQYVLTHLRGWARPKRMPIHLTQFPSSAWVYPEPYGVALIIAPWNYPLLLIVAPLVGAMAAGNCAILKPSEMAAHTSALLARLIGDHFDPRYIAVVEGGPDTAQALLHEKFDTIFYTGNRHIGRQVMQAAARHLTPVTLELGGKSPCIVDAEVDVARAARRILWGKFLNAGQICLSPDYVLADRRIKPALLQAMRQTLLEFYGPDPRLSPDYCRIINARHFERLCRLLPTGAEEGTLMAGGQIDAGERYIAPTIIDEPPADGALMRDEIFGPLLPVIGYDGLDEAIRFVNARPKPLALYFFSTNRAHQERVLRETSSGGGCINDTILHFTSPLLPFGGVGESGMGQYRGRASFDTFSHHKAFIKKNFLFDFWFRFAPYKNNHRVLKRIL